MELITFGRFLFGMGLLILILIIGAIIIGA
jgi:hypothetical protein